MTAGRTSLAARVPTIKKQKFQTVLPLKSRNFPEAKKAFKQEQRKKAGRMAFVAALCVVMWAVDGNMGSVPDFLSRPIKNP